jgi:hypothetical protein
MMQINQIARFDLHQSFLFGCVVIVQDGLASIIGIVVLTRKHCPPKHATDQSHKH